MKSAKGISVVCLVVVVLMVTTIGCEKREKPLLFNFDAQSDANAYSVNVETQWPYKSNESEVVYGVAGNYSFEKGYISTDEAFTFWTKLPQGNYKISMVLGNPEAPSKTTVKAESRRLMVYDLALDAGQFETVDIIVNVRTPKINDSTNVKLKDREHDYLNWDENLTLEFGGVNPSVKSILIEEVPDVPTIFLAGNSTVVDQEREPWASWGQMFPLCLKPEVAVANLAESGETMKSFIGERRFMKLESMIGAGDYVFVEFAHNDQKPGRGRLEPYTTYQEYLMKFVTMAREKGATPVFVTSTNRRRFDENGEIINTLEEFPEAMRDLAAEEGITLVDLNAMSKVLYETLGVEESKRAFVHYPMGSFVWQTKELADNTHFSTYGAWQLARCVAKGLYESESQLKSSLKPEVASYNPAHPDLFSEWMWPITEQGSDSKPDGY